MNRSTRFTACIALFLTGCIIHSAFAGDKPVKVYILAGQSNMVGIGQANSGGNRWASEFIDPVVSVYPGAYSPDADYDAMEPVTTLKLDAFGGTKPTPYPEGGTRVVRGHISMKNSGVFEFRPGYQASEQCVMTIQGTEVHRQEPGEPAIRTPIELKADQKVAFKIVYFTEHANGLGWWARLDTPGTLRSVVEYDGKFPFLVDEDSNWVSRDDVWYKGVVTARANKWLSIGCGAGKGNIGPELGFGWVIGDYHDDPVLIIKASQGNRSLSWDFLPPGSERFELDGFIYGGYKDFAFRWEKGTEPPTEGGWYAGKQYDDCFNAAKEVLANFDKNFPQWQGRGYEIAGFGWWQGHKDTGNAVAAQRYEQNLVQLIKAMRKDFSAPEAPFVIATIGFHGWDLKDMSEGRALTIANAQLAMNDYEKYPAFKGNVKTVETRDFWRAVSQSPKNQDYHYNQNAETYMLVGQAMGKGMLDMKR